MGRAGTAAAAERWSSLYDLARERLGDRSSARWLVEDASGGTWPGVLDEVVTARTGEHFMAMLARRERGEPIQYVLGHWSFRRLDLMVDRRVLVPRPETEVVVEVALAELARSGVAQPLVVDLGTGSGAIAISVAVEVAGARVWATDRSPGALAVASANLSGAGSGAAGRVQLARGDWWGALPPDLAGTVDMVVSNPPYVAEGEVADLPPEVADWEPGEALVAGPDGLDALRVVLAGAPRWLRPGGAVVCEMAPHQAEAVRGLALAVGFERADVHADLAGRDRVLVAVLPEGRRQPH